MAVAYIQALQVTATNDCNYINTVVSYANPNATFPLTGNIVFKSMNGTILNGSPITAVLTSSGDSISIVTPTADLNNPKGVIKVSYEINGNLLDENAVLLACDIDCCLTKLTNELIDCACDCPKCASSLAKAQKIMLLLKSAEYALIQADNAELGNQEGFIKDADSKYKKAFELCDASCGRDC